MATVQEKINELKQKEAEILLAGGLDKIESQHKQGKMLARERLHLLYDNGFYDEINKFVEHAGESFGMAGKKLPGDGVVTAMGAVNGRLVYSSSQDFTVMGGSVGGRHSWKICEAMQKSLKNGVPYIAINDSGGARIQEPIDSLRG